MSTPYGYVSDESLYLTAKDLRSALHIHHEKLRDADHRAAMKKHWQGVSKLLAERA